MLKKCKSHQQNHKQLIELGDLLNTFDSTIGPEGKQFYFRNDDTIGESLRRYGEWARNEMNLMSKLINPGDYVLDIGCNVGTHSMFFAQTVGEQGHVVAIDAQMEAVVATGLTALAQSRYNINVFNVAVGASSSMVKFPNVNYQERSNFGAVRQSIHGKNIKQIKLDELKFDKINFIKLDIEGGEVLALSGAIETLSLHRPFVVCEILDEDSQNSINQFMSSLNYLCELHEIKAFNDDNFIGNKFNIFDDATEKLLICKPN